LKRLTRPLQLVAFAALATLVACGSSSSGGSSPAPSGGSGGSAIPEAQTAVDQLTTRPDKIQITTPLTKKVPTGKKIAWIQCSIPDCQILGPPLIAAAKQFGWTVQTINGGLTPESVKAAWGLAVRANPDAVVATGFPSSIFASELAQLKAKNIPVIDGFVADPVGNGISAVVQGRSTSNGIGVAFANWVLGQEGKKANVLLVHSSTFPTLLDVRTGFNTQYSKLCSDCKVKTIDVPATAYGSTLPAQVVATLRSDPSINYVVTEEGNMLLGIPQAMKAAGITKVGVIGQYPSQASIEYLKDGSIVKALVMPPIVDSMWTMADALARTYTGQPVDVDDAAAPLWIVTQKTAGDLVYPYFLTQDYEAQYKDLWKAGIG
jgi:ABC-type sugar transport system substrate-binding protein